MRNECKSGLRHLAFCRLLLLKSRDRTRYRKAVIKKCVIRTEDFVFFLDSKAKGIYYKKIIIYYKIHLQLFTRGDTEIIDFLYGVKTCYSETTNHE